MFTLVCPKCGMHNTEKIIKIQGDEGIQVCKECGGEYRFKAMPLTIVIGASGTGKSTISRLMQQKQRDFVALDGDLLWRDEFTEKGNEAFFDMWLNMALNISQAGKPVILFMGGMPDAFRKSRFYSYFSKVTFIGLVADDEDIQKRLLNRPAWRACDSEEFLQSMRTYNGAIRDAFDITINTSEMEDVQCMKAILALSENDL